MTRRTVLRTLLVVIASLALLAISTMSKAVADTPPGLERAKQAQERNTERLMAIKGVVGTAVTITDAGAGAVVVLLEKPGVGPIPASLQGVAVKKLVTGKIYALPKPDKPGSGARKPKPDPVDPTARFPRPVPIGVSTGHPDITAGTIGCRVTDGTNVYALSNNHVYANENLAGIDDPVIQPGTYDGGSIATDVIGSLSDFVEIVFSTAANNTVDAAIAISSTSDLGQATPADGYGLPRSDEIDAAVGMAVMKYGRTTGQTKGRIRAINAIVNVGYDTGTARFVNQIVIGGRGFSAGGDSGSLIVVEKGEDARRPVGLLFAGGGGVTIANPIGEVLTKLGVTIDGE